MAVPSQSAVPPFAEIVGAEGPGRRFEGSLTPGIADAAPSGRVRLDALARWLQDIAYADVCDAAMKPGEDAAWIVRRTRMRVSRFPRFGEPVSLTTFCSGIGPFIAERRTTIRGESGLVETVALWVHLDPASWRPARFGEAFAAAYTDSARGRRVRARLRHPGPPPAATSTRWRFRAVDLDLAGHVNNAAHWEPFEEQLAGTDQEPKALDAELEHRRPLLAGEATVLRGEKGQWILDSDGQVASSLLVA